MWRLSGFGDEISPDLEVQIEVLRGEGLRHIDVRAVWDRNVMTFSPSELGQIRDAVRANDMSVLCVGSPIGKVDIGMDFAAHLTEFRRALDIARFFEAPFLRIFSFYIPENDEAPACRDEVLERLHALVRATEGSGVTLVHENEARIYGDSPARCIDLLTAVNSPLLRAIWDPGNFVDYGARPFDDGYSGLRPFMAGLHVKDARKSTDEIVVAGAGDGQIPETLDALVSSGWEGFCSFEPHLAMAGPFGGFSGPDGFRSAVAAFKALLADRQIAWE